MPLFDYQCETCGIKVKDVLDDEATPYCRDHGTMAKVEVYRPNFSQHIFSRMETQSIAMTGRPDAIKSRADIARWEEAKGINILERTDPEYQRAVEEQRAFNHDARQVREKEGKDGEIHWRMEQALGKDTLNLVEKGMDCARTLADQPQDRAGPRLAPVAAHIE